MTPASRSTPRVTINDVAQAVGLAKGTVSLALNAPPDRCPLKPETRQRVIEASQRLGYRPSFRARALSKGRSHSVGLLYQRSVPWMNGVYGDLIRNLADALVHLGYPMQFVPLLGNREQWLPNIMDQRLDGCIIMSEISPELTQILSDGVLPGVLINAEADVPLPRLIFDDVDGAAQATRHLIDLGHRRIVFFHDNARKTSHFSVASRELGYTRGMFEAGLGEMTRVVTESPDRFIESMVADPAGRPTAVIVYDDVPAIKLMGAAQRMGLRVPADLSIVAFNDVESLRYLWPAVTVVSMPLADIAQRAAALLVQQIESGEVGPAGRVIFPETLLPRASTAPAPGNGGT